MFRKRTLSRIALVCCCLALSTWMMATKATSQGRKEVQQPDQNLGLGDLKNRGNQTKISTQPINSLTDGSTIQGAGTFLFRTNDNVFASAHSQGLPPGWAVTLWMIVFNYPNNCSTQPCTLADVPNPAVQTSIHNVGGQIIGADGTANYSAFLAVGDTLGVDNEPGGFGVGVQNPLGAQLTFVVRGHGPATLADPAVLHKQLTKFNGGCPANGCVDLQLSLHLP
jgi:hypothetical protein